MYIYMYGQFMFRLLSLMPLASSSEEYKSVSADLKGSLDLVCCTVVNGENMNMFVFDYTRLIYEEALTAELKQMF